MARRTATTWLRALKSILADLRKWKGDKITGTSLTGVSHGGYFTLLIAAREAAGQLDGLTFRPLCRRQSARD